MTCQGRPACIPGMTRNMLMDASPRRPSENTTFRFSRLPPRMVRGRSVFSVPVARGDELDGSDIDFLVSLEPGRSLLDLARLEARLERLLGRRVDVVTEGSLLEPIRTAALREAVSV